MRAAFICLLLFVELSASGPDRSKGISMHMLPKRVAVMLGENWGLRVDYSGNLRRESGLPVLQTTDEFLAFVRNQDQDVQANGVWIVTTHPEAYFDAEKTLLNNVKALCKREIIPIFVARTSELPKGWKRYDQ